MSLLNSSARLNLLPTSGFTGFCPSSIVLWQTWVSCHCGKYALQVSVSLQNRRGRLRFQITFFHDATERPIQRPKDRDVQQAHYSGKKKQHTVKNNLLITADSKVMLLTPSYEGRIHDKRIADRTDYFLPCGSYLYQDSGFQGFSVAGVNIIQPKKKPKGRDLTVEEKENNRAISSIRIRVEHAIAGIKRYRIVKDKLRNSKKGFSDLVMETCCGLHNFRLNFRPWSYHTHFD